MRIAMAICESGPSAICNKWSATAIDACHRTAIAEWPGSRKRAPKGPLSNSTTEFRSVALSSEDAQQAQQALEHVVQAEVDRQRGGHVIGFAALDHAVKVQEYEGREDEDRER